MHTARPLPFLPLPTVIPAHCTAPALLAHAIMQPYLPHILVSHLPPFFLLQHSSHLDFLTHRSCLSSNLSFVISANYTLHSCTLVPYVFPIQPCLLHCKKRLKIFPSPAGMSLTNSPWTGINIVFPSSKSLVSDIPAEYGKWQTFLYSVRAIKSSCHHLNSYFY